MSLLHPLIHDWNNEQRTVRTPVMLDDETLRDGLQSPSVRMPVDRREDRHPAGAWTRSASTRPTSGCRAPAPHVAADVERLARDDRRRAAADPGQLRRPDTSSPTSSRSPRSCSAPACRSSAARSSARARSGSTPRDGRSTTCRRPPRRPSRSPSRQGLTVMYVTEDTTRADPDVAAGAVHDGDPAPARRACALPTPSATPRRTARRAVVRFRQGSWSTELGVDAGIDWHGHRDRGFGVASALAALEAGATRLHGAALGIGERCGNTPIDLLLVNLVMMGYLDRDLTQPAGATARRSRGRATCRFPPNYPVVGARRLPHRHRRARRRGREGLAAAKIAR